MNFKEVRIQEIASGMADAPFGSKIKNHDYVDQGALVVQGKNIGGRRCDWSDRRYVSLEKWRSLERSHVFPGDLIFPKVGTIGKVGILTKAEGVDKYVLSTNTMCLRVDLTKADPDYVYYFFSSPVTSKVIQQQNANSVQPVFNFTSLKNFFILLPPLKTQKEIAKILLSLDEKIELNFQMNETLESIAKVTFKDWFIDFGPVKVKAEGKRPFCMDDETASLFPDSFENSELGRIPKGWRTGKLDEIAEVIGGSTPSTAEASYYCEPLDGISWLSPKDLSGYFWKYISHGATDITESGLKNSSARMLPAGAVLFSSRAPIGYVAIAENELCTNQGFKSLVPKNGCNTEFLYYLAKAKTELIESRASGSTFKEISGNGMKEIPIIVPTNQILEAFKKFTNEFTKLQKGLRHETNNLIKARDLLLSKLISGKISLNDV